VTENLVGIFVLTFRPDATTEISLKNLVILMSAILQFHSHHATVYAG